MGDIADVSLTDDDSSDDERRTGQRGFLSRLIGAISPSDEHDGAATHDRLEAMSTAVAVPPAPGLGNLRRMRVEDVMIPKAEIVAVPLDISRDGLVKVFSENSVSRLPVYKGTLDTPLGIVHLKDFALTYGFAGRSAPAFALKAMLRPLLFVPPSMPLGVLLHKMQAERVHMALVIDEYGGVDGLVTIEDLIEQVLGEIEDEHDTAEDAGFVEEKPGVWLAKATTDLTEFESAIGRRLADDEDEEEIDTLGGLVFMLAGRVPARGEVVQHPDGHEFEIVDADPRRIKRLRVRLHPVTGAEG